MGENIDLVTYGTPLEPLEEDEVPKKKPIRVEDQIVTDENGRRRFHGAFTGGFSAGYYNTVSTKEGWAPSTFKSSRSSKAEYISRTALDIMDDEDKGEHGISHQAVRVTSRYEVDSANDGRKRSAPKSIRGPIPGEPALSSLIVPFGETIGITILKKMGWKLGQGIGPRMKYKDKRKKELRSRPSSENFLDDDLSGDEHLLEKHSFAPTDTESLPYVPKDNMHGLGYKGLDKSEIASGHINLFEPTSTVAVMKNKTRLKISGQAFGVGAFEDEDEDIYLKDDMSRYDFILGGENNNKESKNKRKKDICTSLQGFHIISEKQIQKKIYRPPELPKSFVPKHVSGSSPFNRSDKFLDRHSLSVAERGHLIGEEASKFSVFDLVSSADRDKLLNFKNAKHSNKIDSVEKSNQNVEKQKEVIMPKINEEKQPETIHSKRNENNINKPEIINQKIETPSTKSPQMISFASSCFTSSDFKPFKTNPEKQKRYEMYLQLLKSNRLDELESILPSSMIEWEKEREKDEFVRASNLYRPMNGIMASRFTTAKHHDDETKIEVSIDKVDDRSDEMKAADMKMFGKMTRKKFEWHPDKILCRRFNVPNPYPGCEIIGIPKVQKERATLFNFIGHDDPKKKGDTTDSTDNMNDRSEQSGENDQQMSSEISIKQKEHESVEDSLPLEEKRPSIDIFKAIFASDESSASDSDDDSTIESDREDRMPQNSLGSVNRTEKNIESEFPKEPKSASGVFANIDFDVLNKLPEPRKSQAPKEKNIASDANDVNKLYGPALPPVQYNVDSHCVKKKKKEKKKKKSKQKHKKDKKKKTKRKRHKSSDDSSNSDDNDEDVSIIDDRDIAERLRRIGGTLKKFI